MTPKITEEMRQALRKCQGQPLAVEDDHTQRVYMLISAEALPSLWEDYVRHEVGRGLAAIDRGEVLDWNPDAIKAEGKRALDDGSQ